MGAVPGSPVADPRTILRSYRGGAPWRLRELAGLAGAILERTGVTPVSSAASTKPSERTIRFYVSRGLVNRPDGRGTSATYSYRHLLQVLAIKLRQMEGATLDRLATEFRDIPGDVLEHRVATALGPSLPAPDDLTPQAPVPSSPPGAVSQDGRGPSDSRPGKGLRRITVAPGVEMLIDDSHPAWDDPGEFAALSARVAESLAKPSAGGADTAAVGPTVSAIRTFFIQERPWAPSFSLA